MKTHLLTLSFLAVFAGLSGCATISEEDCAVGAWSEYGYEDGLKGRSSDRVTDYAKKCSEYGVKPDSRAYLDGYDRGVVKYCTYERGYERGENGDSYNQICSGPLAIDFAPGYDAGRAVYEIYQEHSGLVSAYNDVLSDLYEVRRKLREDELTKDDRRRLLKKEGRLEGQADNRRIDVRAFERIHDLPKHQL
ncbi:MAG: DUF2799 domain-containing protein [Alphaproteobacteria bacterium]